MTTPKIVQQWFKYAHRDIKIAKASLELSSDYKNISAFHAQQCAEKSIKGYLAFNKIRFQKTHNVTQLLDEIAKVDIKLAKKLSKAKTLTVYAVTYRYPDAERKPLTVAKTKTAIKVAEQVFKSCLAAIKK
jgi:HEPN domain-containing protein